MRIALLVVALLAGCTTMSNIAAERAAYLSDARPLLTEIGDIADAVSFTMDAHRQGVYSANEAATIMQDLAKRAGAAHVNAGRIDAPNSTTAAHTRLTSATGAYYNGVGELPDCIRWQDVEACYRGSALMDNASADIRAFNAIVDSW